jgi:hypothetical protein
MCILTNLPEALLLSELSAWLTIKDVARLDSAMCTSALREEFLTVALRATLQYQADITSEDEIYDKMNDWIIRKGAAVAGFHVTRSFLHNHEERVEYLKKQGHGLVWVKYGAYFAIRDDVHDTAEIQRTSVRSAMDVAQYCPNLRQFHGEYYHGDSVLVKIAQSCPQLENFKAWFENITDVTITALSKGCSKLKRVDVWARHLSEECLIALVRSNRGLTTLSTPAKGVTDTFICELGLNCRDLEDFYIPNVTVSLSSIYALLEQCPRLRCLALDETTFSPMLLGTMPTVSRSMRELFICAVNITNAQLSELLTACPGLTVLDIATSSSTELLMDLQQLRIGARYPSLQKLRLSHVSDAVADEALLEISQYCPLLRALDVYNCAFSTDALCAVARQCPLLQEVAVGRCWEVTDEFLVTLAQHCPRLLTLDVSECRLVTDKGLAAVMQGCPGLAELDVSDCRNISKQAREEVKARIPRWYF